MIARWMAVGFGLWLVVSLAFRYVAQQFPAANPWLLMVGPFVLFGLVYLLLAVLRVDPADRAEATGIMAVPGLLIGTYEINSFSFVFGDIDHGLNAAFASLMYSCYAATILAGVVSSRLQQKNGDS